MTEETGLTLPPGTVIIDTEANTLSLADGPNYNWFIKRDVPLTDWIEGSGMTREDGDGVSWFSQVAPIADPATGGLKLDSVWKSERLGRHGMETAYIYVAEGRRAAFVTTFRP